MKHLFRLTAAALALATNLAAAHAADLIIETEEIVPAPAPTDWTGFYLGVFGGIGGGDVETELHHISLKDGRDYPETWESNPSGMLGGALIGYNQLVDPNWLLGAEADLALTSISASFEKISGPQTIERSTGVDWYGTLRGHVGFVVDDLLVYGTGGLAYGSVQASGKNVVKVRDGLEHREDWSGSEMAVGWTAGVGAELKLTDDLSVKLEYAYVDLGTADFLREGEEFFTDDDLAKVGMGFHTVKAGLNFQF